MVDFDKLNRETRDFNNRNVDRFNPSTRSNYSYFDPYNQGYGCYNKETEYVRR